jgi:hypothetical protein
MLCVGFIWLKTGTSGGLLLRLQCTFGFDKRGRGSLITENLSDSQGGSVLCSQSVSEVSQLVSYFVYVLKFYFASLQKRVSGCKIKPGYA